MKQLGIGVLLSGLFISLLWVLYLTLSPLNDFPLVEEEPVIQPIEVELPIPEVEPNDTCE